MFINTKRIKNSALVLTAICLVLTILHTAQGARITDIKQEGSLAKTSLTFSFNNNLDENATLLIITEPSIANSYSIQGNVITVTMNESLKTSTNYKIKVENITDVRGKKSTATHNIETEAQSYAMLHRNKNEKDKIIIKTIGNENSETMFEEYGISDYAVGANKSLLVITEEKSSRLSTNLYKVVDSLSELIQPPIGIATSVTAVSSSEYYIVNTRDTDTQSNHMYSYNLANNTFIELTNPDGSSIHSSYDQYASDNKTILYQSADTGNVNIDNFFDEKPPLVFGTAYNINRLAPDDSFILVESKPGFYDQINTNGVVEPVEAPPAVSSVTMTKDKSLLFIKNIYSSLGDSRLELTYKNGDEEQVLYTQSIDQGSLSHIKLSNNDEYASVEYSQQPVIYDNYLLNPRPTNAKVQIFDIEKGTEVESTDGILLRWL